MRLIVISDTHRDLSSARRAFRQAGSIDLLIHAGDHYADAVQLGQETGLPVKGVTGNCDWCLGGPGEEVMEIEGVRVFLTHGHRYGVKGGTDLLLRRVQELDIALVIYGHTHVPENTVSNGIRLFNPGSVSRPRFGKAGSFGIIEITKEGLETHILYLDAE
ncbi:hypothetical protein SY88_21345 [Clostridiales bacterium PH28_bin88]|nr:hypothetical protein SY88_21345 [Clostridiales bacterium PH28_bin88]